MIAPQRIVIIGGGFAGTALAKRLEKLLAPEHSITLISQENYTTFNPMLAEVVGASVFPVQVIAPIRQMLSRASFIMAKVTDIDTARKLVRYDVEGETGILETAYDHLVLAFGSRANLSFIPGMEEYGVPLKLIGDALHIRNRLLEQLESAEQEEDAAKRAHLTHFAVVGGGFSGVEVAGEIMDFLKEIVRYYRRVRPEEIRVTLLHDQGRLLPELPEKLGEHARKSMEKRGIAIMLNARAAKVDAMGVELSSGGRVDAANIICTIGTKPNALVEGLNIPKERGRILTNPDMSVKETPGIWAIGDCALIANAHDGKFAPPTAQFAVQEAHQLAGNLARAAKGQATVPFSYKGKGMLATIGHLNGVAQMGGLKVSGLPAWLLWRAFYLSQMPSFTRKLRIFVEWTWSMFFASDITHLRFTRTQDADLQPQLTKNAA